MSESNGYATREALLAKKPRKFGDVPTPNRGKVRIRALTELDVQNVQAANTNKNGGVNLEKSKDSRLRTIVASIVDAEGNLVLTNHDIPTMRSWEVEDVNALWEAIAKLSSFDNDGQEAAEKNSVETTDDGSQ
jgi:hypothetical protein